MSQDHLFISYAEEDSELAIWLTLKLTSMGYAVWCDKFKNLGGESYPINIDDAIKNRTFRVIALLSRNSNDKPNPLKERTLAANISKDRKNDFLIPINVDGIRATELNWMMSDLVYISFYKGWAKGLIQLLEKLASIDTPKILRNGKEVAASEFLHSEFTVEKKEQLSFNYFPIQNIPQKIKRFVIRGGTTKNERAMINQRWAVYGLDDYSILSFSSPPIEIQNSFNIELKNEIILADSTEINNIPIDDIVSNLLLKSIYITCYAKGLRKSAPQNLNSKKQDIYFPKGLFKNDKIYFTSYGGNKTWVKACSGRRVKNQTGDVVSTYFFYLSPRFKIRRDFISKFSVSLTVHLFLTDDRGQPLRSHAANAKRKKICKDWWNHEWLSRYLAVLEFLSGPEKKIIIGETPEEQIIISTDMVKIEAPVSIDENAVIGYRKELQNLARLSELNQLGDTDG